MKATKISFQASGAIYWQKKDSRLLIGCWLGTDSTVSKNKVLSEKPVTGSRVSVYVCKYVTPLSVPALHP